MPFISHDMIGSYLLLQKCGRGAYGDVWIVEDPAGRHLAMKILDKVGHADMEMEGLRAFMKLPPHPHLVSIYHIGEEADFFYYTMELADNFSQKEGEYKPMTLANLLVARENLSAEEMVKIGLQLLKGLSAMHHGGLIHRDIKPENVIFVNGIPKISDIGLVTSLEKSASLNGTFGFITPERLLGKNRKKYTESDDLYAMGKVLYCLWSGNSPEEYPSLPNQCLKTHQDSNLNLILKTACNQSGARRFQSAAEFMVNLENYQRHPDDFPRKKMMSRRCKGLLKILLIEAIVALGVLSPYLWRWGVNLTSHPVISAKPSAGISLSAVQPGEVKGNFQYGGATQQQSVVNPLLETAAYVVIDLSGGPTASSYPIRTSKTGPDLKSAACRTHELWLRRIPAGTFMRGAGGNRQKITLTRDYFLGVLEVTQRQWELVMGNHPALVKEAKAPVDRISFADIRGESWDKGGGWPVWGHAVDEASFLGILRKKTGLVFDLPTAAQWDFVSKKEEKRGDIAEFCLDWDGPARYLAGNWIDAVGPVTGNERVLRGGKVTKERYRNRRLGNGFRLALLPYEKLDSVMPQVEALPEYVVIDLSAGPSATWYPVRYSVQGPDVKRDVCRTTELWLKRIPKGSFWMGSPEGEKYRQNSETRHKVTLTRDYYMGIFEVTQAQYMLVCGANPSRVIGDTFPVEWLSYSAVHKDLGFGWPSEGHNPREDSFMGKLQLRTGLKLDLPTEAEWEYACRAGSDEAVYPIDLTAAGPLSQEARVKLISRYSGTRHDGKGKGQEHTNVGSYLPNAFGLYDMLGNVWEYCLDWFDPLPSQEQTNPQGPISGKNHSLRVTKGSDWCSGPAENRAAFRRGLTVGNVYNTGGFRVAYSCDVPVLPPLRKGEP